MLPLQEIFWWACIYFFSFIIICAITMMNLLIAVIVDVILSQKNYNYLKNFITINIPKETAGPIPNANNNVPIPTTPPK